MLLLYLSLVLCACTVCQAKGIFDIISRDKGKRPTWSDLVQQVKRVSDLETMQRNTKRGQDCLSGWKSFEHSRYCFVASEKTWFDANVDCQRKKSYLVEIESHSETQFIDENVRAYGQGKNYWIGATYSYEEGMWIWYNSDNELTYTNWLPERPRDNNGKHYAYIEYGRARTTMWNNEKGSLWHSFICEMT